MRQKAKTDGAVMNLAALVNAYGGTAVIASKLPLEVGKSAPSWWGKDSAEFEQPSMILREATKEEYLAFPWPLHVSGERYFYEIGFD